MFDLRGRDAAQVVILDLPRTSEKLLPRERMRPALRPYSRESVGGINSISAVMLNSGTDLPIRVVVIANFETYSGMPGDVSVEKDFAIYKVSIGQRPHWLRFTLYQSAPHFLESFELMLSGPEFRELIQALRGDMQAYVQELDTDEALMAALFEQIDRFVGQIQQGT